MSNLSIRKKSTNTWLHTDSVFGDFIISKFYFNSFFAKFQIVEEGNARLEKYEIANITLYDDTDGGVAETFTNITELSLRLEELQYPAFDRTGTSVFPSMEQITNVNVTDIEDGQVLAWDVATSKWVNITIGSSTTPNLQEVTDEGANTTNAISTGGVGINTTTPEAIFDAVSTSSGILIPRMTTTQRNAISTPVNSMLIYNTTTTNFEYYKDAVWVSILDYIPNIQQVLTSGNTATDEYISFVSSSSTKSSEFGEDNITFTDDDLAGQKYALLNTVKLQISDNETNENVEYRTDKIIHNFIDYPLPTGEESQIDKLPIIVSANKTAENDGKYTVIANATFTDPTPAEGKGYTVFVRNGTATIGGVGYTAGSLVYRVYHSGAWSSTSIGGTVPDADASTKGIAKLYTDLLASNTDGSVHQSAIVSGLALKQDKPQILNLTSDYTLTSSTSAQKLFNVGTGGNGAFDATASTIYEFELFVDLSTLSSTSGFFSFSLTGTATYNNLRLKTSATKSALISGSVFDGVITSASAYQLTTASIATVGTMTIKGLINVNGAGTITPTITLSQASAGVVLTNSYCKLTKI